ncbi:MAG: hypothetical protein KIT16_15080 [Rhodospirillaceae bacterium]|nr:hypothetical protein [Rhodospirillaceae bacterium]
MKDDLGNWIILFVSMAVGLLGLVLAARGVDTGMALAGWLFFIFGVGLCFRLAAKMSVPSDES